MKIRYMNKQSSILFNSKRFIQGKFAEIPSGIIRGTGDAVILITNVSTKLINVYTDDKRITGTILFTWTASLDVCSSVPAAEGFTLDCQAVSFVGDSDVYDKLKENSKLLNEIDQ